MLLFEILDNVYMYVCVYVWIVHMPFKRARGELFLKKHGFLGLTPVYSETTALSKPYFILKLQSVKKFLRKFHICWLKLQIITLVYFLS